MKTKPAVSVSRASLWHIPLAFLVAMALVPVLFALLYSFKSLQSIYGDAGLFTSGFTLDNYRDIARQLPIVQITLNTLTVAVLVTACKLLTSILAAYAFVFTSFRGKTVLYFLLIVGFSYFYATMQFNPIEVANNLKKNGGFIPGFRPGKPTADFMMRVLNKITMFGALYLSIVALAPIITGNIVGYSSLAIGGTSIIIVVGVALETVRQLEAQMLMRHYKGFLE